MGGYFKKWLNMIPENDNGELIGLLPVAGSGTRMKPITDTIPKALIEVQGKNFLERGIEVLKMINVNKIIIVTGYLEDKVHEFVNSHDFNIPIELVHQEEQRGLAHTIAVAEEHLTNDFLLYCPDNIYSNLNDILEAYNYFLKYNPSVLHAVTVIPTTQQNRSLFYSGIMHHVAPNVFDNTQTSKASKGIPMLSTGIHFFKKDVMDYLPDFSKLTTEHKFPEFLATLKANTSFMLYLLFGGRYDFTEPEDIDKYTQLQEQFTETKGEGISVILINVKGQVLLHLRDDIPTITYPNHWALFGGSVDHGETPYDAIKREVIEELQYDLVNFGMVREFVHKNKREYAFVGELTADIDDLTLSEGQDMKFFQPSELSSLKIRPDDRDTLAYYYKEHFNER